MRWQGSQSNIFFTVDLEGQRDIIMARDVVSLTIIEELELMPRGTLVLRDPNIIYSDLVPRGAKLNISWGYTKGGGTALDIESPDRIAKGLERRGMRAWVTNPNGESKDSGESTYNLSFLSMEFRGNDDLTEWTEGTKGDVVRAAFRKIGIVRSDVRFDRSQEAVTDRAPVIQAETDFKFLARIAREWGAVLIVGHSQNGDPVGAFLETRFISESLVVAEIGGRRTAAVGLTYKSGKEPNVLSYKWRHHEGESGVGDSVSLEYVEGKAVYVRRTIEGDKVTSWRLDESRIEAELDERLASGGATSEANLVMEIAFAKDFESVKRFFYPWESETAPNGIGYTIEAQIFGDTTAVPGSKVVVGQGFPSMFREVNGRPVDFFIRKNTHILNNSGYFSNIEVVDAFTLSPTGMSAIGGGAI